MAITWNDVLLVAPELSTLTTDQRDRTIAEAYLRLSVGVCGDRLDLMAVYLCAHMATVSKRKGLGGQVTGQSVGQVSRQYSAVTGVPLDLGLTSYGLQLHSLIRTTGAARWVVA